MSKYRPRRKNLDAYIYSGDSKAPGYPADFCAGAEISASGAEGAETLTIDTGARVLVVAPGDYVGKTRKGELFSLPSADFTRLFEVDPNG